MMATFCITSLPLITPRIARMSLSKAKPSSLRGACRGGRPYSGGIRSGGLRAPPDDDPGTTLSGDERPEPLEEDRQAKTRLSQRHDVDQGPREPRDERLETELPA